MIGNFNLILKFSSSKFTEYSIWVSRANAFSRHRRSVEIKESSGSGGRTEPDPDNLGSVSRL